MTENSETLESLRDIHRGLHVAMDAALKDNDAAKLKITLHQLDDRLRVLIDNLSGQNSGGRW